MICSECGNPKTIDEVRHFKGGKPRLPVICYECLPEVRRLRANAATMRGYAKNSLWRRVTNMNGYCRRRGFTGQLDWEQLREQLTGKCPYCGFPITQRETHLDHVVPLSRGGTNTNDNVALVCGFCNLAKADRDLEEFLRWLKYPRS